MTLYAIMGAVIGGLAGFFVALGRSRRSVTEAEGEPAAGRTTKPGHWFGNLLGTALIGAALGGLAGYMVFTVRMMGYKPSEAIVQITTERQFTTDVLSSDKPVLVEFYTQWCTVCHQMMPAISEIADETKGRAVVAMVDAEALRAVAGKYEVNAYPIFVIIYKGEVVGRYVGGQEKETLSRALAKYEK